MLMRLSLGAIVPSPDNPRKHFDAAFLAELGRSLRETGQFTPCLVRPHPSQTGKYELAAGESRLKAATLEALDGLDCFVRPMTDAQFLEVLTFENLKRRDLRPLEEARSYALLQKRLEGWTVEKIAEKSGVSVDYVRDRMRLLQLVPEAQGLLDQQPARLPLSHALEIAKLAPEQQRVLVDPQEWEGAWRDEDAPYGGPTNLFDERKRDALAGRTHVSLRELKRTIAERFPVDPEADGTAELFPELAAAMQRATEKAMPVVHITDAHADAVPEEGQPKVLGFRDWRRADGTPRAKACKHAKTLGVGVHAGVRGQAFLVCLAKTDCRTHFGEEIRDAEARAAHKRVDPTATTPKVEDPWEKRKRLERAAKARFKVAEPAVLEALAQAVATASTTLGGPLDQMIARDRPWPKGKGGVARGTTPEELMRFLAWQTFAQNLYNAHEELSRVGKLLGVNVAAIVTAAQPTPEKKAKPTPAAKSTVAAKTKTPTKTPAKPARSTRTTTR